MAPQAELALLDTNILTYDARFAKVPGIVALTPHSVG